MSAWYTSREAELGKRELLVAHAVAHGVPASHGEKAGLTTCSRCGQRRGVWLQARALGLGGRITCICEGISCRCCGKNNVRRPFTDHFRPGELFTSHTPWFGYLIPCRECQEAGRGPDVVPYEVALERFEGD